MIGKVSKTSDGGSPHSPLSGEFDFRYSTDDTTARERADISPKNIGGKRLTYRRTDKLAA